MTTRSNTRTSAESFNFVFDVILEQPEKGNIRMCCEGMQVRTLDDMLELTALDMERWTGFGYPTGDLLVPVAIKFGF